MRWIKRMVKTLEQYTAEAEGAYQPAVDAVQNQINALSGQLDETNARINKNYAQQRARLNNERNDASYYNSLQIAANGGGFGGQGQIAADKYNRQSFVPAITQLNTNLSNDLSQARQSNDNERLSLESQLANMRSSMKQQALQAYYNAMENEANRALQRQQIASSNRIAELQMQAAKEAANRPTLSNTKNRYGGYDWVDGNGNKYTAGHVAAMGGGNFNDNLYTALQMAAAQNDAYSKAVLDEMDRGYEFAYNPNKNTGNAWYDTLGITKIKTGRY